MDRIEEIKKRVDKSDNVLFFDKHELDSLKKITKTTKISDYEVLTDDGFIDIEALHETIPYEVYNLKLSDGKELKCADNHIVFVTEYHETTFEPIGLTEVFVKDLEIGSFVMVSDDNGNLTESEVIEVTNLGYEEVMYDLELKEGSNRRYYTNGILSHNTYLAKQLAKEVFGSEDSLIRIDMSEFQEKHTVSRLIGSPPGYVGYDEGGQLTEQVKNKPYSVVLFDEIEKANKDIFSVLLQILDDGHITDSLGRKINFKNCLIIMTSNLGVKRLQEFGTGLGFKTDDSKYIEEEKKRDILKAELKKFFAPEFLNRVDDVIVFNTLKHDDVKKIVVVEMNKLNERLTGLKYNISFDDTVIDTISKIGFDELYGARPLKRAIQDKVEDFISEEVLKGNVSLDKSYILKYEEEKMSLEEVVEKKKVKKKKGEE
jgi:hypothetical protein